MNTDNQQKETQTDGTPTPRRHIWRVVKWLVAAVAAVLVLVCAVVGTVVAYLQPARLTPLVCKYADEYLLADIEAAKVELSFWSTFPKLTVSIDTLAIDSHALDHLPDSVTSSLPAGASRLLEVSRFSGSIDIPALLHNRFHIYDVTISDLRAKLVKVSDSVANYLIAPPSTDSTSSPVHDITIDHFALTGNSSVSYYEVSGSRDITIGITTDIAHSANGVPAYLVRISGTGEGTIAPDLRIPSTPVSVDGRVEWTPSDPYRLAVRDMTLGVDRLALTLNTDIDFSRQLTVNQLRISAPDISLSSLRRILPESMQGELRNIEGEVVADLNAELTKPFNPSTDSIPSGRVELSLSGAADYDRIHLRTIEARILATVDGLDPDRSSVDIKHLKAIGRAMGFEMEATIDNPVTDPRVKGVFKGGVDFASLPKQLTERMGLNMEGLVTADTRFDFRLSHLSSQNFHHMKIDGNMSVKRFHAERVDSSITLFASGARLHFGTSSKASLPTATVDSLLTVSISTDTIAARMDSGMVILAATSLKAGIGTRATSSSLDTTKVLPVGGRFSAGRLYFRSIPDSMVTRLNDVVAHASITRYKGNARVPRMQLKLDAGRVRYSDPFNRASVADGHFDLSVHLREADSTARARRIARRDSLLRSGVDIDSLVKARRALAGRRAHLDSVAVEEGLALKLSVDRSVTGWLRRLKAHGSLAVGRGRVMSRFFPLVARTSGIAMRFTTDSITIDSASFTTGSTSLRLSGTLSNITRAMTSLRQPWRVSLDVDADTFNINEIAEAIFAGSDFAANIDSRSHISEHDNDDEIARSIRNQTDTTTRKAVIIPGNVEAEMRLRAANVLYSDIWFQRIEGNIGVRGRSVHLNRLAGYTPMGSMSLSALYSAPRPDSLRFAAGMVIRQLHIDRFLHLMPQVDSLLPLLRDVSGIVTADMAMSSELDSLLDLRFHTLEAVMRLSGDSLGVADPRKFEKVAKLLRFKHRDRIMIDHMDVELMVRDSRLDLFPFMFDIDRYRFGVSGSNDLGLNLDYHIAVLKSPIPFRFGVNIKGRPGHVRFSLGRAHFDEKKAYAQRELTDTTRINLIKEIEEVFRFGVRSGKRNARLQHIERPDKAEFLVSDTLTHADSLLFIQEGVFGPAPASGEQTR